MATRSVKTCDRCKSIYFHSQCLSCYGLPENTNPQWDWKMKWPKCREHSCDNDVTDEDSKYQGFDFCEKHLNELHNELAIILYDFINPNRVLSNSCNKKEYHYKTICPYSGFYECVCDECGQLMKHCDCKR